MDIGAGKVYCVFHCKLQTGTTCAPFQKHISTLKYIVVVDRPHFGQLKNTETKVHIKIHTVNKLK